MGSENTYTLSIKGHSPSRNKNKSSSGRSKYRGRSKYLGIFLKACWRCGKEGNCKKGYKFKIVGKGKGSDDSPFK